MLRFGNLIKGEFVRNVSVLAGGTAFAQALAFLALPLLTRIYSPEEFGVLAVFAALLGMISVIACLRYDIAIPLPESDQSAANLLAVALVCLAGTTAAVTMIAYLFGQQIAYLMNALLLAQYLWLLPIAVVATGAYSVFQFWATRKKAFARIARTSVEQSIGGVATQLLMGLAGMGALGLIVGQIMRSGAGFIGLAQRAFSEDRVSLKRVHPEAMKSVAREYDRFPKYSTFEALTNSAGVQLPILMIASLSVGAEVGCLMLAMQIIQAPMSLIGSSISQVYFSHAVDEQRNGRLGDFTARTIGGLAKIGVGPLIGFGIIAPSIFGYIFGAEWQRAGELVTWMTPWFVLQFLASPVSMSLHVTGNQKKAMVLTVSGLLLRVSLVWVGASQFMGGSAPELYAISGFIFYSICLYIFCSITTVSIRRLISEMRGALPFIALSIALAIALKFAVILFTGV